MTGVSMEESKKHLMALKLSSKGQLSYDRGWRENIKAMLEECTSPPPISKCAIVAKKIDAIKTVPELKAHKVKSQSPPKLNGFSESFESCSNSIARSDSTPVAKESIEIAIQEYEIDYRRTVQKAIVTRCEEQIKNWKMLQNDIELQMSEISMREDVLTRESMEKIRADREASTQQMQERQQQLKERHTTNAKLLDAKLREAEFKKQKLEDQNRRHILEKQELVNVNYTRFRNTYDKCHHLDTTCLYRKYIPDDASKHMAFLQELNKGFGILLKIEDVSDAHIQMAEDYASKGLMVHDYMKRIVAFANEKGRTEQADIEEKQRQQLEEQEREAAVDAEDEGPTEDEVLCVSQSAYMLYDKLRENMLNVQKSYEPLITDPSMKNFKADIQKAVNTPVNAISPTNGAHLRDKLTKLHSLLTGQTVRVINKSVCAGRHPAGVSFAMDLLARKIVKQGEEQVSSQHEAAFAIATVTVSLWSQLPEFGALLLAHFYAKCPYLVPYYIPKQEWQSAEDYYRSLGYNYVDGKVEKQDKFLHRMSGIMRLYSSIMVSTPSLGPQHPHPHGMSQAWTWLVNTINIEPRPDITATMLHDFLSVTGHALEKTYSKQFHKILHLIITDYMNRIHQVTPEGCGGPVTRLETFIEKCIKNIRNMPQPVGVLAHDFW